MTGRMMTAFDSLLVRGNVLALVVAKTGHAGRRHADLWWAEESEIYHLSVALDDMARSRIRVLAAVDALDRAEAGDGSVEDATQKLEACNDAWLTATMKLCQIYEGSFREADDEEVIR